MRLCILALTALAAIPGPGSAETVRDEQAWVNLTLFGRVTKDVPFFVEVQPRVGDDVSSLRQFLLRGAIGTRLTPGLDLYQGYAHVVLPGPTPAADRNEERSFQQLLWTIRPGFWVRTRFEQRWLSSGHDVGFRLRSMVRYAHPLMRGRRSIAALASVEPFVALNRTDWGARAGLDQVRGFAGLEIPTFGRSTIEVGYLGQRINEPAGRTRMNHVASLNIFFRP